LPNNGSNSRYRTRSKQPNSRVIMNSRYNHHRITTLPMKPSSTKQMSAGGYQHLIGMRI
jgi:hypothetical protein